MKKRGWTVEENWENVIFSDETQIVIGKSKTKLYIWRKDEDKYLPQYSTYFEQKFETSVMFWGCVCYKGVGTLTAVDWNMNTNKYIEILDTQLLPWIFQEAYAPCHFSKVVNKWETDNNIETLRNLMDVSCNQSFWNIHRGELVTVRALTSMRLCNTI